MRICAVISEFNPFHNGHKYLINEIKTQGFTHIVAIMSGNFVQRGEPAIIAKEARTKAALLNGIDLVIEIPTIKVLNSAEKYAKSAVEIADGLGCADAIAFGSECADITILKKLADILENKNFEKIFKKYILLGNSFPKSQYVALKEFLNDSALASVLKSPNNVLGIEYIKALRKLRSNIKPITVKRNPAFLSSSEIRNIMIKKDNDYKNHMPDTCFKIVEHELKNNFAPFLLNNAQNAILYSLRSCDLKDILKISDVKEGLENRIISCASSSFSVEELLENIKTKRYTMARIKRVLMLIFLKITKNMQNRKIPYIKVLGLNKEGVKILKKAKKTSKFPIISRFAEIKKLGEKAVNFFEAECKISKMHGFFANDIRAIKNEKAFKVIKGEEIEV